MKVGGAAKRIVFIHRQLTVNCNDKCPDDEWGFNKCPNDEWRFNFYQTLKDEPTSLMWINVSILRNWNPKGKVFFETHFQIFWLKIISSKVHTGCSLPLLRANFCICIYLYFTIFLTAMAEQRFLYLCSIFFCIFVSLYFIFFVFLYFLTALTGARREGGSPPLSRDWTISAPRPPSSS